MGLRRRHSGMTLVEMLAAVGILVMITTILAQVFTQATRAASKGKGMGEMYQVARAIESLMERDLSGATPDFFACAENGGWIRFVGGLPPGPYSSGLSDAPFTDSQMRRMLMGGSDYLALTSANAAGNDQGVAKVFYVLRATGELIRVSYRDTSFNWMDYLIGAVQQGVDLNSAAAVGAWEERRVVAENIQRLQLRFLDRSNGPVSRNGAAYAHGLWVEEWDWNAKPYLPAAVEVELQLVDHLWTMQDEDQVTNRFFDPTDPDDNLRACESFDADDGESFRSVISLPLGMN